MINQSDPNPPIQSVFDLEYVCDQLAKRDVTDSLQTIWSVADLYGQQYEPQGLHPLLATRFVMESRRLKLLLTENTCIKQSGFLQFTDELASLTNDLRKADSDESLVADIVNVFSAYASSPEHFGSLSASARLASNGWGKLIYCAADEQDFFAAAAGNPLRMLVHADQWLRDDVKDMRDELARAYAERINNLSTDNTAIVLVRKEFGPLGPEAFWNDIKTHLQVQFPVVRYDQTNHNIHSHLDSKQSYAFLVLYDLLNTGDGLREIEDRLQEHLPVQSVSHIIMYDYGVGNADSPRGDVHRIFDARRYPALEPDALAEATFTPIPDPRDDVFGRIKLHHVNPRYGLGSSFATDHKFLSEDQAVRTKYAGQWVAVHDKEVLASDETRAGLEKRLMQLPQNPQPTIRRILPSPAESYAQ